MELAYEEFEGWGDPEPVRGRRKASHQKETEFTPENRILTHMKRISPDLIDSELADYKEWVKKSIKEEEVSFEEGQLSTESINQINRERTKVTHKPSQIYGLEIGTKDEKVRIIQAKGKAYLIADAHFKLWLKTSEDFRDQHLKTTSQPETLEV